MSNAAKQTEVQLQQSIRLALGCVPGLVLWRNSVGQAKYIDPKTGRERTVTHGLGVGSSDLIGCYNGRFIALEIKTATGRVSSEQLGFLACVRANGGFGAIVRSVEDAKAAIERASKGATE